METVLLPAQDQLAYCQSKGIAGIMYSGRSLPHAGSHGSSSNSTNGSFATSHSKHGHRHYDNTISMGLLPRPKNHLTTGTKVWNPPGPPVVDYANCSPSRWRASVMRSSILKTSAANSFMSFSQTPSRKPPGSISRSFSAPKGVFSRRTKVVPIEEGCNAAINGSTKRYGGQCRQRGTDKMDSADKVQYPNAAESNCGKRNTIERGTDGYDGNKMSGNKFCDHESGTRSQRAHDKWVLKRDGVYTEGLKDKNVARSCPTGNDPMAVGARTGPGATPAVMILQRPASGEAAAADISRLFGDKLGVTSQDNGSDVESLSLRFATTFEGSMALHGVSRNNCESDSVFPARSMKQGKTSEFDALNAGILDRMGVALEQNKHGHNVNDRLLRASSDVVFLMPVSPSLESSPSSQSSRVKFWEVPRITGNDDASATGGGCREIPSSLSAPNERWAGPAFSNSPPPSSLPLPKFSIQQLRTSSLEILATKEGVDELEVASEFLSSPSSPSRRLSAPFSDAFSNTVVVRTSLDIAVATKDLRRMLNLDLDC